MENKIFFKRNNKGVNDLKIICAGVRRSGSTWVYNCIKLILKEKNKNLKYSFVNYKNNFKWGNSNDEVIKILFKN